LGKTEKELKKKRRGGGKKGLKEGNEKIVSQTT